MVGRDGGKAKPLKKPKPTSKELTEEDLEFKKRQKEEQAKLKAAQQQLKGKGKKWLCFYELAKQTLYLFLQLLGYFLIVSVNKN